MPKKPRIPIQFPQNDALKSAAVSSAGRLLSVSKSPDVAMGEFFDEVQKSRVYDDGKTFPDLVPRRRMRQIKQEYMLEKQDPQFDLRDFVSRHFYKYGDKKASYKTDPNMSVDEHIKTLWNVLERRNRRNRGSLVALPYAYVVPGGRFNEQFYWDSYFIMLGLAAHNKWDSIENMVKNYAYMIRKFGFIPTANRTYFLSRSQPPFFSQMVKLLARHRGRSRTYAEYLPYMLKEYNFWMKGHRHLGKQDNRAYARVAQMDNGSLLNRYYDNRTTPRPESLREDMETADGAVDREASRLYLHLRAGAESGWDFSSRWFTDPHDIKTIHTADIIPVDLNSLLYMLEETIAETYEILYQPILAKRFRRAAEVRRRAIEDYCWQEGSQFYEDYNFHHHKPTGRLTLAAVFPLYAKIATNKQASAVAKRLEAEFLREGGLITTLIDTGQQWDNPNGWAPLQWVAIQGLRNYGHYGLADEIKKRWINTNINLFEDSKKLVEKYNVINTSQLGGGGEYPLQDGFGWTNGVLAALMQEDK